MFRGSALSFLSALLFFQIATHAIGQADDKDTSILSLERRPSVREVQSLPADELDKITGPLEAPTESELKLFKMYEGIVTEVLARPRGEKIFIMGRKGEPLFDALQTLILKAHPDKAEELLSSVKMIPISSEAAKAANPSQLRAFLTAHGVDIPATLNGRQRQLWLDMSSNSGTTEALFDAMVNGIRPDDSEREHKIKNLFQTVDSKVLIPHHHASKDLEIDLSSKSPYQEVRVKVQKLTAAGKTPSNEQIREWIHDSLKTWELTPEGKASLGLPEDLAERYAWFSEKFLPLSHWHGKPTRLTADGTKVDAYGEHPASGPVDSLLFQRKLQAYFSTEPVVDQFKEKLLTLTPLNARGPPGSGSEGIDPPYIIPEIVDLPEDAVVPKSVYETYDSRTIGESLVFRLHTKDREKLSASKHGAFDYDMFNEADLVPRVPSGVFGGILQKGFLSQHKSGTSKGSNNPTARANAENNMIGLKLEPTYTAGPTVIQDVRPKYGWVSLSNDTTPLSSSNADAANYGEIIFWMKDEVKRRTTYTKQDSLGTAGSGISGPGRTNLRAVQGTFYENKFSKAASQGYNEVQMWGEVDLKDVRAILIPPGTSPETYKQAGLPIFEYQVQTIHGRPIVKRTKEVWSGDFAKMAALEEELAASRKGFVSVIQSEPVDILHADILQRGQNFEAPSGKVYQVLFSTIDALASSRRYRIRGEAGKVFDLIKLKDTSPAAIAAFQKAFKNRELESSLGLQLPKVYESDQNYLIEEALEGAKGSEWYAGWIAQKDPTTPEGAEAARIFAALDRRPEFPKDVKIDRWVWTGSKWAVPDLSLATEGLLSMQTAALEPIWQVIQKGMTPTEAQTRTIAILLNREDPSVNRDVLATQALASPEHPGSRKLIRMLISEDLKPSTRKILITTLNKSAWNNYESDRYRQALQMETTKARVTFLTGSDKPLYKMSELKSFEPFSRVKTQNNQTLLLLSDQSKAENPFFTFQVEDKEGKVRKLFLRRNGVGLDETKIKEEADVFTSFGFEPPKTVDHGIGYLIQDVPNGLQSAQKFHDQWRSSFNKDSVPAKELIKIFVRYSQSVGASDPIHSLDLANLFWTGTKWTMAAPPVELKAAPPFSLFQFAQEYVGHIPAGPARDNPEFAATAAWMINGLPPNMIQQQIQQLAWNIQADAGQKRVFNALIDIARPEVVAVLKANILTAHHIRAAPEHAKWTRAMEIPDVTQRAAYLRGDSIGPTIDVADLKTFKFLQPIRTPDGKTYTLVSEKPSCAAYSRCYVVQNSDKVEFELDLPIEKSDEIQAAWKRSQEIPLTDIEIHSSLALLDHEGPSISRVALAENLFSSPDRPGARKALRDLLSQNLKPSTIEIVYGRGRQDKKVSPRRIEVDRLLVSSSAAECTT